MNGAEGPVANAPQLRPLRALIVDDEPPARARLKRLLEDASREMAVEACGELGEGQQVLEAIERCRPDVVLLDISMPDCNGIDVASAIAARSDAPAVIFVTAHDEHALQAFEVHALDYLLKPVSLARLVAALRRVPPRPARADPRGEPGDAGSAGHQVLSITERGRVHLVPIADIIYFRAELKYTTVRTRDREYLSEQSLANLEAQLGSGFVRVHRSTLVARASIEGFQRVGGRSAHDPDGADGHWEVILRGLPERLPVSRRQWPQVKSAAGLG